MPSQAEEHEQAQTNFGSLPGELIGRVASFLNKKDINQFRLTNRSVAENTITQWAKANILKVTIWLSEDELREALGSPLRYKDVASQITQLRLSSRSAFTPFSTTQLDLLQDFLSKFPNTTSLELASFTKRQDNETGPFPVLLQLLDTIYAVGPTNLKSLSIETCSLNSTSLTALLSFYSKTLRNLRLTERCWLIDEGDNWDKILAYMRDHMRLDSAYLDQLFDKTHRTRPILYFNDQHDADSLYIRTSSRVIGTVRNPETKRIEQYMFKNSNAQMTGGWAVKLGLNQILGLAGSEWYDSSLPK